MYLQIRNNDSIHALSSLTRGRQYSARSASFIDAVSSTAANLSRALQPSASVPAFGYSSPRSRACLRQLYRVPWEIPSSAAISAIGRLYGGDNFANTACLRSFEYLMDGSFAPRKEHSRGCDNYPDRGGCPSAGNRGCSPMPPVANAPLD